MINNKNNKNLLYKCPNKLLKKKINIPKEL